MCSQILIIIGLLLNLLGVYKLHKSIIPRGPIYAVDGPNEDFRNAVLDINVARIGLGCVFIGIIFQIIAMAIFIYSDIII